MEFTGSKIIDHHPYTSISFKDEGEDIAFRIKFYLTAQALVVEGIENNSSCSIRRIASPLHRPFPIISGMAPEVPLGNLSLCGTAERNAHMLQFINDPGGILDHNLDGILITEIITPLDRIEEMPFPVILLLITQRSCNPTLGCP
jgi:hypothetical protein